VIDGAEPPSRKACRALAIVVVASGASLPESAMPESFCVVGESAAASDVVSDDEDELLHEATAKTEIGKIMQTRHVNDLCIFKAPFVATFGFGIAFVNGAKCPFSLGSSIVCR
jgi:hypothetical protein